MHRNSSGINLHSLNKYKFIIFGAVVLLSLLVAFKNQSGILYGDALGYYTYLPATFIHGKLKTVDEIAEVDNLDSHVAFGIRNFSNAYPQTTSGHSVIQYTYGIAAMNFPAFAAVYLWDKLRGVSHTGFERRFQSAIKALNVFYLFAGLYLCFLTLCHYFKPEVALASVSLLLLGTNLFWFGFVQFGMAHVPQFFLIALLCYLSVVAEKKYSNKDLFAICLLMGLITIIRPTDLLFGFVPLYLVLHKSSQNGVYRDQFISSLPKLLGFGILLFLIPILPQLFYWKHVTGQFLFDSYGSNGFNWTKPEILKGLFGPKNGWFTYTPLMLLAVFGFISKVLEKKWKVIFLLILPVYIYVCYAWFNYYYINGFGSRPMIHVYPIMVFGLAALLSISHKIGSKIMAILMLLAVYVNLNYTNKADKGQLFPDESTHSFNISTFFKSKLDYSDLYLLGTKINQNSYGNTTCELLQTLEWLVQDSTQILEDVDGTNYFRIKSNDIYPGGNILITVTESMMQNFSSLKVEATIRFQEHVFMPYDHQKIVMEVHRNNEQVYWECISLNEKIGKRHLDPSPIQIRSTIINEWDEVAFHFPTDRLKVGDKIKTFIWNPAQRESDFKALTLSACK